MIRHSSNNTESKTAHRKLTKEEAEAVRPLKKRWRGIRGLDGDISTCK